MTDSHIYFGQPGLPMSQFQYACGELILSGNGASACWEDQQGVLILYGYIHNDNFNSSPQFWLELLQQPAETLANTLNQLDGAFNLFLLDKVSATLKVVTDRLGGQRLHFYHTASGLWLNPNLTALVQNMPEASTGGKTFDPAGLLETVHFRWLSGTTTLFSGVRKLQHAAVMTLSPTKAPLVMLRYGLLSAGSSKAPLTLEQHADTVRRLLSENIAACVKPDEKVAVLLSGGVDSSILLAICCQLQLQVVAITPSHQGHVNPELETAKTFARELGVEHRVLSITDDAIAQLFERSVTQLGSAPRCHSTLSLMLIMQQLSGEFASVLYGEGADTLFGSRAVKHFAHRYSKYKKLKRLTRYIPASEALLKLLPEKSKLRRLASFNVKEEVIGVGQLSLCADIYASLVESLALNKAELLQQLNTDVGDLTASSEAIRLLKQVVFSTSVINHFYELETLASAYKIKLVSPFVCWSVMSYAANLSDEDYFGQRAVKPILRKIGEQYFTPELMYLPKYGFPVPHINWLSGPLKHLSEHAAELFGVPPAWLKDDEFAWTLSALYILAKQLKVAPVSLCRKCDNRG